MALVRASDEDRQRVIGVLQRHTEEGRLSLDEFSDRVGTVYAAKTLDDLRAAVVDLPALARCPPPSPRPPPVGDLCPGHRRGGGLRGRLRAAQVAREPCHERQSAA
ncbi:DUF1707 SHOCT-like domain-containing protein [Dactylosporangium sp. CA-139114]|uniref:DUF1707 SHOCT-like domain-containing protein n=1 Tax=Dactylosporangium sp. CA-139114 TaxID=3239931 RepID=UPI003D98A9B6